MELGRDSSSFDSTRDELLAALAERLDIRDLFRQLSAVAGRTIPHDEAHLVWISEDTAERLHVSAPEDVALEPMSPEDAGTLLAGDQAQLLDTVPGRERGLHSGLKVPVTIAGRVAGALVFLSRHPRAYSARDVVQAQRLAPYLAVWLTLAKVEEQARALGTERQHSLEVEASAEMLRTIADVLDVRTVFPQLSEIARKLLPHDAVVMVFTESGRHFVGQAVAPSDFPDPPAITTRSPIPDDFIVGDVTVGPLPEFEPPDAFASIIAAGYRAMLSVRIPVRERHLTLAFWSKQPHAFHERDVPMARRVADYVGLAVSHEQLAEAARQAAEARARADRLEARVQLLSQELESKTRVRVVGESAEWRDVLTKATQVAETDTTVLITGESGTGKEVVARYIHRASARSGGPFIALNCAALPEQLLESELFGYERGAFTSAQQAKPGQIELAAGGVLFLDEVTEMSPSAQAKFLRVLQEREFQRLGGIRILKANIRVIAATNGDLMKAVERGDFRHDLFYRLRVFDIRIPPLRERRTDILPVSEALLEEIGKSLARPPAGLTRSAREALLRYEWPGNVRELRNALERAAILCQGGLIHPEHFALQAPGPRPGAASTDLRSVERETIAQVLQECRWNKARAARRLGLSRTQLYGRMRKFGLEEPPLT